MSKEEIFEEVGIQSTEFSIAKSIDKLSNPKGRASKILSNLTSRQVPRLTYQYALSDALSVEIPKKENEKETENPYEWIKVLTEHELDLRSSVNRRGTRGRDDLVKISQTQAQEQRGVLASFKEKIQDFFSSG